MRKAILFAIICLLSLTANAGKSNGTQDKDSVSVQSLLTLDEDALSLVNNIFGRYTDWKNVTFNGKLRADKLPVSPSIRIYAEKGTLIQLSVRVPLLGEVGRLELTPDEVVVVNKMKKNYIRESAASVTERYPNFIADIQSLLLGRVVILGEGQLSAENLGDVDFQPTEEGLWVITPVTMPMQGLVDYGYVVTPGGRTSILYGDVASKEVTLRLDYIYGGNSMDMKFMLHKGKKDTEVTLDFSTVRWGGERMSSVNLDNGYRQVSIADFVRNLK